jgi:TetR/AcrR family transcriptional repressor of nem operon
MSKEDTRSALIETGKRMIFETGFNHTGIQSVLSATGIPKGSFYYYFSSKEDFGLAVIEDFVAEHQAVRNRFMSDDSLSPLTTLRRYFAYHRDTFARNNCEGGCLLGNLGQELSDQNDTFRERLSVVFDNWRAGIADSLRKAKAAGEIAEHWEETKLADFCLSSWQGALLRMKVAKNIEPLDAFISTFFDDLLRQSPDLEKTKQ